MDRIKAAARGAYAAAEALVRIDKRGAAAEAAGGLFPDLFLGKGAAVVAEAGGLRRVPAWDLSRGGVTVALHAVEIHILLFKGPVSQPVAADDETLTGMHEAVDGYRSLLALGNRVNGKLRAGMRIAADKDVGLRGLIGDFIGLDTALFVGLQFAEVQSAQVDALADRGEDGAASEGPVTLADKGGDPAVFALDGNGFMLEEELHALFLRLGHLGGIGGHVALPAAVGHGDIRAEAHGRAGHVHGHVAAADHDNLFADGRTHAGADLAQEVDAAPDALELLARDAERGALLRADGEIEGLEALSAKLIERHIPADFDAAAEDHTQLLEHVDLRVKHGLLQTEARDPVTQHAARLVILLEDRDLIVVGGEEVGTAQAGGAGADDGDLFVREVVKLFRHEARIALEFAVGDEFLDLVDGDGAVDIAAGAGFLAFAVADAAADGGQGVFFLDEFQRLKIASLRGQLQIALHGDVGRAGGLAGCGTLRRDVLAVGAVLGIPVLRRPLDVIGQFFRRVIDRGFGAELLPHLDRVVGTVVRTLAAGDTFCLVDFGNIVALGGIGRVVVLRNAQRQAALGHTVADGQGFALIQRRDLVDAAALLAFGNQRLGLVHGDRAALAGAVEHIAHMAHEDAEAFVQIAAAFVHQPAHAAALTGCDAQMPVVVLDVPADTLVVDLLGTVGDGALERNDAHDARAHGRIRRVLGLAVGGVLVESIGDLGMGKAELLVDEEELEDAGRVGRQEIDLEPHFRQNHLHHEADVRDLVQDLAGPFDGELRFVRDDRHKRRLHAGHGKHDGDLFVGDPLFEHFVFRAVRGDFIVSVVDLLTEPDQVLSDFHRFLLL